MLRRMAAVFVHDFQAWRQCELFRAYLQAFGDDRLCRLKIASQFVLGFTSRTSLGYSDLAAVLTLSHQARKSGKSGDMKSANALQRSGLVVGSRTTPIRRVQTSSSTIRTGFLAPLLNSIVAGSIFKRRANYWLMARANAAFLTSVRILTRAPAALRFGVPCPGARRPLGLCAGRQQRELRPAAARRIRDGCAWVANRCGWRCRRNGANAAIGTAIAAKDLKSFSFASNLRHQRSAGRLPSESCGRSAMMSFRG